MTAATNSFTQWQRYLKDCISYSYHSLCNFLWSICCSKHAKNMNQTWLNKKLLH